MQDESTKFDFVNVYEVRQVLSLSSILEVRKAFWPYKIVVAQKNNLEISAQNKHRSRLRVLIARLNKGHLSAAEASQHRKCMIYEAEWM